MSERVTASRTRVEAGSAYRSPLPRSLTGMIVIVDINELVARASDGSPGSRPPLAAFRSPVTP